MIAKRLESPRSSAPDVSSISNEILPKAVRFHIRVKRNHEPEPRLSHGKAMRDDTFNLGSEGGLLLRTFVKNWSRFR